ncbi:MAG: UDP-glucose 4-epimerase GalE [Defluviitaleaceae bacterium]|nr:UDP-glucose 4-epimerase GalE [Defluviitaleaceae bacterium]MCL2240585.1 UDP-glucose 4-epimerase GalE [Defluviitaleaceae bacterium]
MVLVTGGAGYIGSHTCVELLNNGYQIAVIDNLSNSHPQAIDRVKEITGRDFPFHEGDVCDEAALDEICKAYPFDCVIHFAGLKAVGESVDLPLAYYKNNIGSTVKLLEAMGKYKINNFIFSSSATVYSGENTMPLTESSVRGCINPYGWTKFMNEQIIRDTATARAGMSAVLLRYFNPIGAHESGQIGENPSGVPNNLMPFISQTVAGKYAELSVYGNDYDTPDGTCIRDYIHVTDLAAGHVAAIRFCQSHKGTRAFNLGTGQGTSVLEMVHTFERVNGVKVPYRIAPRRPGDFPVSYADPSQAEETLHWRAEKTLEQACADTWRWQKKNPNGYS